MRKIRAALDVKLKAFGEDADEAMRFFNGPYDWLYSQGERNRPVGMFVEDEDWPQPSFRMTNNKVAEMVQLFGPTLYHKNPYRLITPRAYPEIPIQFFGDPNNPQVQQSYMATMQPAQMQAMQDQMRATLLDSYLNYTPYELGLKDEVRLAIDECIIKGLGVLWTELYRVPESGFRMVGSFYDTVDNLVLDPDSERLDECKWIARRCCHPVWEVEREYGLPPGTVKGNLTSWNVGIDQESPQGRYWHPKGQTADLLVYWKIYSKMGMGGRLAGVHSDVHSCLDAYGDYIYLVCAESLPFPLNLPPTIIENAPDQEIIRRLAWPTPFWKDGTWPFTPLQFHTVPRQAWPMSHLKPALGELKFLNWAYSFMASRLRVTSRTFIGLMKSASEEIKKMITHGPDLTVIEIEATHQEIGKVVQFLQQPPMNTDILTVIEAVSNQFDKRTGLTELMYGETSRQIRSAEEAQTKSDQMKIRPEDMLSKIEEAMTEVAKKEAIAARWHLTGQDVLPIIGPVGAYFWTQVVTASDPDALTRQMEYRLESSDIRKPNRERQAQNASQAMQTLLQPLYQYAQQTGNVGPINALIGDWAKSIDLDAKNYLLSPPPPPVQPAGGGGGPPASGAGGYPPPSQGASNGRQAGSPGQV
jgi:hypothetical protein